MQVYSLDDNGRGAGHPPPAPVRLSRSGELAVSLLLSPQTIYAVDLPRVELPGDLDCDCDVDAFDLAILLGSWGPCPNCVADLNDNGAVDAADLANLLGAWGPCE